MEQLESRYLLAGDFNTSAAEPLAHDLAPITWFESFDDVSRIELDSLDSVDRVYPDDFQGPRELAAGEWIVQLSDRVSGRVHVLRTADRFLDEGANDFSIIAGLGSQGLMLVRGQGVTAADIEASLAGNEHIETFSLNSVITGQITEPNDSDYVPGLLRGLTTIDAPLAWDESTGSMQTVVGVVDSGIDLDHPDLYLNIWLNQGEIPATIKDDLVDIDGDGLITFYDLNNLQVINGGIYVASTVVLDGSNNFVSGDLATEEQLTTATPHATGVNAAYVRDLPGDSSSINGRIDPVDLLFDPMWSDGRDTDQNGFFDDFFGVNFRSGGEDPFAPNQPDDALGHGTHVAGTIGAIGNNHIGVVGVNWQTSLMSLRILDNNNRSDAGAGLRAVNYAKMMRERQQVDSSNRTTAGANVRVLNNSWGQPGGYEPAFESAIRELGDEGILFVAAAGNGDIFGDGVDNDQTPFYPASYDVDNVIAVAASTFDDRIATFSNYGETSVDLAAPGTGIRSTLKDGGYGTANGTSMATPHVAGAATLIWSAYPQATVDEVAAALVNNTSIDPLANGTNPTKSGGRLNVNKAIDADVFAPSAVVIAKENITTTGGTTTEFTIEYSHRDGIDLDSIDDNDVIVTRQWGPAGEIPVTVKPGTKAITPTGAIATYIMEAPGGGTFSNSTNVVIQDDAPNTVLSPIWVDNVSGLPTALKVTMNIRHTSVSDLTITLIAPNGARAILVSGKGGSADDFVESIFSDDAATSIVEATAPFTGTFRPEQNLSTLLTANVNGEWMLEIDDASNLDGGSLENWSLGFAAQWDAFDYGEYRISTVAGEVTTATNNVSVESRSAGSFDVRITDDPSILYVDSFVDSLSAGSLRNAIQEANTSAPSERTIILESGTHTLDIPPVVDPDSSFGNAVETLGLKNPGGWSNADSGDFDITGNLRIIGDTKDTTILDAGGIDRVFKLHPQGRLVLERLTIQGGVSPASQGGGGILSLGDLRLDSVIARENGVRDADEADSTFGGAIAAWSGQTSIQESWITGNQADFGGGVFYDATAGGEIQRSTFDNNLGGGVHSYVGVSRRIENSTFSANRGGLAVIATVPRDGILTGNDQSNRPSISGDGRYVAFQSNASNLVPGDTNGVTDIFLYDLAENTIERISVGSDLTQANGASFRPSISGDGRFVAFASMASNLVPGDTNDDRDVFLYDRTEGSIERVSKSPGATEGNDLSEAPSISSDGRFIAFASWASNLVPGDTNANPDVFVYDRSDSSLERVSLGSDASEGNGDSWDPSISDDGRFVAFESDAGNLVPGDNNGSYDIFVYDRTGGTIERISTDGGTGEGNGDSFSPSISSDGRYVTFESTASNLVPNDSNGSSDVFVYDRTENTIERVSSESGVEGNNWSESPSISGDGRYVSFVSLASNLVTGDANNAYDIFVYDRIEGRIEKTSLASDATEGNGSSFHPSISDDGRFVAFESSATNLVQGDLNEAADIFVRNREVDGISALTFNTPELPPIVSDVSHVTIAHTGLTGTNHAVAGDIRVTNTLFSLNSVTFDLDDRSERLSSQNIFSTSPMSDLISPLARIDDAPPIHSAVLGNPAIDWAAPATWSTLDQLGQTRLFSADAGAVETTKASIVATVYVDQNRNGLRDSGETGASDFEVKLATPRGSTFFSPDAEGEVDINRLSPGGYTLSVDVDEESPWRAFVPPIDLVQNGSLQPNGASWSADVNADGRYMAFSSSANNLVPGDTNDVADIFVYDRIQDSIERVSVSSDAMEANSASSNASISGDGRFVAFQSTASNLIPGDTNGGTEVFVYDRVEMKIERINGNGASFRPSISADGRYVAFESGASNLVSDDTNGTSDVFVYDRVSDTFERVSLASDATEGDRESWNPSISADGQFVAFESNASNLVPDDANGLGDVFVYDRNEGTIERVSRGHDGTEANGRSRAPSISDDGRYVAFGSESNNLVPGDTNDVGDGFVYDRIEGTIERVTVGEDTSEGNGWSYAPSISGDGRYVAFSSWANNLVTEDTNNWADIFVRDRSMGLIERVTRVDDGTGGDGFSDSPTISVDGRYVGFQSEASNLVPGDTNGLQDAFLAHTPLITPAATFSLSPGEVLNHLELGVVPDPGRIRGRVFEDVVANGVYDLGEPIRMDTVVFLDLNFNHRFDEGEPKTSPNAKGMYEFTNVDSFVSYSIIATLPTGFEQVAPGKSEGFAWEIFLPAGGDVTSRDFGFRPLDATGQSNSSEVNGRLFEDTNGNGLFEQGVDVPHGNIPVYLDANNNRRHNIGADEPITLTNADGTFSIDDLNSRIVTLRTQLDDQFVHKTPLGNLFDLETSSLYSGVVAFDTASAVTHSDFNLDGFEDLAVLVSDGNLLAIRMNDQQGGFAPSEINIPLGETSTEPGTSLPLELVVGQFNGDTDGKKDVAIVGQSAGNVLILLDFDHNTGQFASRLAVDVGDNPVSLTSGFFDTGTTLDLAVLNSGTSQLVQESPPVYAKINETFQILTNDGTGTFTAQPPVTVPGDDPVAIVSDDFNGDDKVDLAVLHTSPTLPNTPFGDVALFTGDGAGVFALSHIEPVEGGPLEMVSGDFNGDGIADLAVANVAQNTMSILAGRADGAVIRETAHPIGTGEKGIDSMDVADIDNDGDLDIVATRLSDGGVAIFRNITDTTANPLVVQFEPLESFGVAQASIFERAPIVLANFDNDTSGPGGEGTIDFIAIPKSTATINVLTNTLVDGGHRVALDGLNTISGLDFIITPTGDVDPPVVTDVKVAGADWTTAFKSAVDPEQLLGFRLPGTDQLRTLPWDNLDTIYVEFNEDVEKATGGNIDAADLTLGGINITDYETHADFGVTTSYSNGGGEGPFVLTIQLAGASDLAVDRLTLGLESSVVDLAGNVLDGDWTDGTSTVSGDGTSGGDFVFHFNVLPGDVDGSGGVLVNDVLTVNATQFTFPGVPTYQPLRDVDGSGSILVNDVLLTNERQFTFLPPEPSEADEPVLLAHGDAEGEFAVTNIGSEQPSPQARSSPSTLPAREGDFEFVVGGEGEEVAGIKLAGELESYVGDGTYQIDFYVEAVGAPVIIAGFNAPLMIGATGVSFAGDETAFEPNAAFDLEFVTSLGSPMAFGVSGSLGAGLQLDAGQREVLFTIDLVVDSSFVAQGATDVVSVINDGPFASALQFTDSDFATIQNVTIESAAQLIAPVPPTITINPLAIDPADLQRGTQPTSWAQQRSRLADIQIELDEAILAIPEGSITLTNLGVQDSDPGQAISLRGDQISLDPSGKLITLSLDAGQLPGGRYQLELSADITGNQSYQFTGDDQNRFFVSQGDFDGNNSVDLRDLATIVYWIDDPNLAPAYVDLNEDGTVSAADLVLFRSNFAAQLDVPGLTDAVDPAWIDTEALGRAENSIATPQDVNGSGMISPLDALQIINGIASQSFDVPDWRFDTNRDGQISPRDALFVVNTIALQQSSNVELSGEDIVDDEPTVVLDLVGQRQTYSGPGQYTFEFTVTAIGGDQTISGFNLPLAFDVPEVTFDGTKESFHPNPAFNYEFVATLSESNRFGVSASSNGVGLELTAGQPEVLFSIVVDVAGSLNLASPSEVATPIASGSDSQALQFIGPGIATIDPPNFVRGAVLAPPGPAVHLSGVSKEYTGAGTYSLDFMVESVGGPVSIAGFSAPLVIDVPGVTFAGDTDAFTANAAFQNEYVAALAQADSYGVAGSVGPGLQLAAGEQAVLFTIELEVSPTALIDPAAAVAKVISSGALASSLQLVDAEAEPIPDVRIGSAATLANAIVTDVTVNDGSSARSQVTSLTVTFDALVDHAALASAFQLTNLTSNLAVGTINVGAVDSAGQTIATLTFNGESTVNRPGAGDLSNSLADGNYRLDILDEHVDSPNGQRLFGDQQFGEVPEDLFFRFLGDSDGDRDVDGQDYGRFGLSFLKTSEDASFNPQFDSDGDGDVDGQDYGRFGLNFLKTI